MIWRIIPVVENPASFPAATNPLSGDIQGFAFTSRTYGIPCSLNLISILK